MIELTENKIPVQVLSEKLYDETCGGIVTFEGRIRKSNHGKEISKVIYECYYPMALKVMDEIKASAFKKWNVKHIIVVHRIGDVPIGEVAIWIGVTSTHRKEAFEACKFLIDEIKSKAPIWKKESD
ncbi:MAG: molybdenum cofactor biosynthesis protein MoaE [Candidatus Melainabacteria bacterium]|nr:molybdenum cofactor biosynthesis protein MoaE [Candidatus Melainabacteria bacterium]